MLHPLTFVLVIHIVTGVQATASSVATLAIERPAAPTESIRVMCRFRPESDQEVRAGGEFCVDFHGSAGVQLNIDDCRQYAFGFHRVFQPFEPQTSVFEAIGPDIVDGLMAGLNCAVLAYGQTGTGKTFTMIGDSDVADGRYVCMCVCVYVRMCVYVCMYVCMYVCLYVCMYVCK